ncbi:unnamed protein product [Arabis nemorensis]|uniref:Uncharacterized protein n=1 Tax=Arabis nemorensis TaxID=586526 RepID=A0A565CSH0_9BRAS|nr:unnamed protein product [Arabis nemorensis]
MQSCIETWPLPVFKVSRLYLALPRALLRVLCVCGCCQPGKRPLTGEAMEVVPFPMAMAVLFLVGGSYTFDMCIGSLVVFVWEKVNRKKADGSSCCIRFDDMWRWSLDSAFFIVCSG